MKYFIQMSDQVSRPLFLPVTVSRMRALNRLGPGSGVPAVDLAWYMTAGKDGEIPWTVFATDARGERLQAHVRLGGILCSWNFVIILYEMEKRKEEEGRVESGCQWKWFLSIHSSSAWRVFSVLDLRDVPPFHYVYEWKFLLLSSSPAFRCY